MRGTPNIERRQMALTLRFEGLSFRAIGVALGVTSQRAQQLTSPSPSLVATVVKRAGGRCEACQEPVAGHRGHIHHRAAKGMTSETYNTEPNLTLLCIPCHRTAHADPNLRAFWAEKKRRRTAEEKQANAKIRGLRIGAARLGVSVEEYTERRARGEKWCCTHREWMDASNFPKRSASADGLAARCDACNRETARMQYASGYQRRWLEKNREKFNAYQRAYHARKRQQARESAAAS